MGIFKGVTISNSHEQSLNKTHNHNRFYVILCMAWLILISLFIALQKHTEIPMCCVYSNTQFIHTHIYYSQYITLSTNAWLLSKFSNISNFLDLAFILWGPENIQIVRIILKYNSMLPKC